MPRLIIVHGINSKPTPADLRESCRFFLEGSARVPVALDQVHLAFWADLAGYTEPDADDRGSFRPYSLGERVAFWGQGLVKGLVVNAVEAKLAALLGRNQPPTEAEIAGVVAGVYSFVTGPVMARVLKAFLRDVYAYFQGGIREAVKGRVREQLDAVPAGERVGLIGHSLGSVVALDVLTSDGRRVDWLCTLGSPLGFGTIQAQMGIDAGQVGAAGAGPAAGWDNLYDRIDPVALDEDLADDFFNSPVLDRRVENEFVTAAGQRNPHRLYGYLAAPPVGELVRQFLQ